MQRQIQVVVNLTVRDMTQDEWDDANEGLDPSEDFTGPEGWVKELEGTDLSVSIEGVLNSIDNPEMFAGSGLFVHTENAEVVSIRLGPTVAAAA